MEFPAHAITALQDAFDYTDREARFLYLVATHSGHFFRTHYRRFTGVSAGGRDNAFITKVVANGHAVAYDWDPHKDRYHLSHRRVYRLLGREHSNHRKQSSNAIINVRVAGLDFVLDHPGVTFLEDEAQRVRFFVDICGVPEHTLPRKFYYPIRRAGRTGQAPAACYFVDRYPIGVVTDSTGAQSPVLTYVDEPTVGLDAFRTYLKQYGALFTALSRPWSLVFVSGSDAKIQAAEPVFRSALVARSTTTAVLDSLVLRYFKLKDRWERKDIDAFTVQDHRDRHKLSDHYETPAYLELYRRWHAGELDANAPTRTSENHFETFRTYYALSLQ
jgi:hypothetical protein